MKKFFGLLLFLNLFVCFSVVAEENAVTEPEEEETEELNAFGYPDKSYVTTIINETKETDEKEASFIDCNDKGLLQQTRDILRDYIHFNGNNIIDKRKNVLAFKNITNFKNLSAKDMTPEKYPSVAGRIVELKINNHLGDSDIQVCESLNPVLNLKIYLVIYQQNNQIMVDIINFGNGINPHFILEK